MISSIVSRLVILVFGTLYPAYASYKAVRAKNVKEYVKWMMYWIVFALFTCAETFTDVFLSFWFPFYYEIKVILVLWLLSPATKGSSILYRKFVHPMLTKREQEIDEYIARAKEQGYHTVLSLGSKGVNYATSVLMQTAIKNLPNSLIGTSLLPSAAPALEAKIVNTDRTQASNEQNRVREESADENDFETPQETFFYTAYSDDDEELDPYFPTSNVNQNGTDKKTSNASVRKSTRNKKTVRSKNVKVERDVQD